MSIEDRLRQIVTALLKQASVTLLVKERLEMEADDPLANLTVADVARQLGRSPGYVRDWIRRGELEAYQLGKEYRVTRPALTTFCQRQRNGPRTSDRSSRARFATLVPVRPQLLRVEHPPALDHSPDGLRVLDVL